MKKIIAGASILALCLACVTVSFSADEKTAVAKDSSFAKTLPARMPRPNFSMLYGKITKIDSSDPANVKVDVLNEADNATHTITVIPSTNITKATDISELKTGEDVRVMAKKVNTNEVAMGVMFGKIRKPTQRPSRPATTTPTPSAAAPTQEKTKK